MESLESLVSTINEYTSIGEFAKYINSVVFSFFANAHISVVIIILVIITAPTITIYSTIMQVFNIKLSQYNLKGKNILLVIAHPDDEAM